MHLWSQRTTCRSLGLVSPSTMWGLGIELDFQAWQQVFFIRLSHELPPLLPTHPEVVKVVYKMEHMS